MKIFALLFLTVFGFSSDRYAPAEDLAGNTNRNIKGQYRMLLQTIKNVLKI